MNQQQIAKLTLAAYAETHKDIYKCGCEYSNGCNYDHEFDFVCDACYDGHRRAEWQGNANNEEDRDA